MSTYRQSAPPVWSRYALLHRGADYFRQARKPRSEWKTLDDLAPQLAEFDLRCAGGEYDTAAEVLLEIDFNYLFLWGHYRLMAGLHERLQEELSDSRLQESSLGHLGSAYGFMGQVRKAITYQERALAIARERKDRGGEAVWLGNLGNRYADLGQTARAIEYYEQALDIHREIGDRHGEGADLGNLGSCYADLGQTARAIEYYEQAIIIQREIGDRNGEGIHLGNLAETLIEEGRYDEAIQHALEGVKIGEEIGSPNFGSYNNSFLALAYFCADDLPAARSAAEAARQYDEPQHNHYALALLGVVALRQGDRDAAREAFSAAVAQADALLAHTPQYYAALDSKGLALSGLALLSKDPKGLRDLSGLAVKAYRAARAINRAAGIVGHVLRLFDALAVADTEGRLASVRAAAAGETSGV